MPGQYDRKDHLYRQAKKEGYRSRAAYKLLELDKRYKLLKKGLRVLDLGCYPGGWLQVALEKIGQNGLVLGIDLREVEPVNTTVNEAIVLHGDIFDSAMRAKITALAGGKLDVILSDLSPQLSGIRFRDALKSAEMVECALNLSQDILCKGGTLVAKVFPGAECEELAKRFRAAFTSFARPSLGSSRKSSTELYFVARGYLAEEK